MPVKRGAGAAIVQKAWVKQSRKHETFDEIYEITEQIGRGPTSIVVLCQRKLLPQLRVAKIIKKHKNARLFRPADIAIAVGIQHKNLVYLHEVFEARTQLIIVQELLTGKELFDRLENLQRYTEETIAGIAKDLFEGLAYLHGVGLAHRNIKPENLMYASEGSNAPLKICDFALSSMAKVETDMMFVYKTPEYVAPEVLKGYVNNMHCDIWSLGVILFVMLWGYLPFHHDDPKELYKKIIKGNVEFHYEEVDKVSPEAKCFVLRMLNKEPKDRVLASKALLSPWANGIVCTHEDPVFLVETRERIKEFNSWRRWRRDCPLPPLRDYFE